MRIDVFFGPQQLTGGDSAGRVVAVIDVLRASTTIAVALHHGAKAVVPFESSEDAVLRSKSFERRDVKLAGERRMAMIPGFDLGNSPAEFTREAVEGKTVLLATTNGTPALTAVQGARDIIVASFVNFSAVGAMMRSALRGGTDVAIVCAGRERQFSLEDAACAGRYAQHVARGLDDARLNDAAHAAVMIARRFGEHRARLFEESEHGRALVDAGFASDLATCGEVDAFPVIPVYAERQITKLGPDRER